MSTHHPPTVIDLGGGKAQDGYEHPFPSAALVAVTSLAFQLTCAGGGGARTVIVQLLDGTQYPVFSIAAPDPQPSGATVAYSFAPGVTMFGSAALGYMGGPFPAGRLPQNMTLEVIIDAAGAADVLSAGRLLVQQFPVG